jgi:hypothetical protein
MITKVKNVQAKGGEWKNRQGETMYPFEYEFEDGVVGEANHKTQQPRFPVGSEVDYKITGTTPVGDNRLSLNKPDGNQGYSKASQGNQKNDVVQDYIIRQSSLQRATEVIGQGKDYIQYTALAEYFFNYVKSGEVKKHD